MFRTRNQETTNNVIGIDVEAFEKKLDKQFRKDTRKAKRTTRRLIKSLNKLNKKTARRIGKLGPIEQKRKGNEMSGIDSTGEEKEMR